MNDSLREVRKRCFVIAANVVGSSEMEDPEAFKRLLSKACDRVNNVFGEDIVAPMKSTKGFERISGALVRATNAYKIVSMIVETIHPRVMRFAIVYGPLHVSLDSRRAPKMNGAAFRKATELVGAVRTFEKAHLVTFRFGNSIIDYLLSSHVNLVLSIKNAWTNRQFEVMTMYARLQNQQKVAKLQGVSQPTISTILKTADRHHILDAEDIINYTLANYPKSHNVNIVAPLEMKLRALLESKERST